MSESHSTIHPKENIDPELRELLDYFAMLLDKTVDFGAKMLAWDIEEAEGGDENIPITLMFRHIVEMIDSISILVKQSSTDPAKLLLRGVFESMLQLEYILEEDTSNRAFCFAVYDYNKRLKVLDKLKPGTQANLQLKAKMRGDKALGDASPPNIENIDQYISQIEAILNSPSYKAAEEQYQTISSSNRRLKNWYQLSSSSIESVEQLAQHLNRQGTYEVIYRAWSGAVHGIDVVQGKVLPNETGGADVVQIRYPEDVQVVTHYAILLAHMTYRIMAEKRLPNHMADLNSWYNHIRLPFLQLGREKMLNLK